jgi:hypothetical protein
VFLRFAQRAAWRPPCPTATFSGGCGSSWDRPATPPAWAGWTITTCRKSSAGAEARKKQEAYRREGEGPHRRGFGPWADLFPANRHGTDPKRLTDTDGCIPTCQPLHPSQPTRPRTSGATGRPQPIGRWRCGLALATRPAYWRRKTWPKGACGRGLLTAHHSVG